jgi:hypothetical protein
LAKQVASNFQSKSGNAERVRVSFGRPVDLSNLAEADSSDRSVQQEAADQIMGAIRTLGDEEQARIYGQLS